jgi:hypothetical protein
MTRAPGSRPALRGRRRDLPRERGRWLAVASSSCSLLCGGLRRVELARAAGRFGRCRCHARRVAVLSRAAVPAEQRALEELQFGGIGSRNATCRRLRAHPDAIEIPPGQCEDGLFAWLRTATASSASPCCSLWLTAAYSGIAPYAGLVSHRLRAGHRRREDARRHGGARLWDSARAHPCAGVGRLIVC